MNRMILIGAVAALAAPVEAQLRFEVEAAGGYTLVDVYEVADLDGAIAQDWSQPNYRLAARVVVPLRSGLRVGAEVSHQYLYWYSVRIPYGSQPIRREYDVTATSAMGLLRLGSGRTSIDLGVGVAFLEEPVGVVSVALGWEVVDDLAIKARADGLWTEQPTLPLGLGFSYGFQPG